MNPFKIRIKIADLVAACVILSFLAAVLYFAFDPKESANKKYDSMYSPTATNIQNTITDHFKKLEKPYADSVAFAPGAEVLAKLGMQNLFADNKFITVHINKFFIGKAKGVEESFYVCFVPASKFTRDSRCNDSFVYTLNSDGTKTVVKCGVDDSWNSSKPWVICSPR